MKREKSPQAKVKDILRASNYKYTRQREKIIDVLLENVDEHLSADDVYNLVKDKAPDISLSTVYRTLELFQSCNILHGIDFGDGCKRYELTHDLGEGHHHHHLICLECGKIIEVKDDLLENLEENIGEEYNFDIVDHQLKFFGYCEECLAQRNEDAAEEER